MKEITLADKIMFNGRSYIVTDFITQVSGATSEEQGLRVVNKLYEMGKISIVDERNQDEQLIDKIMSEMEKDDRVDQIYAEEQQYKENVRQQKLDQQDNHSVTLEYIRMIDAEKVESDLNNEGIMDTCIMKKNGKILLQIENVTLEEAYKIGRRYKTEKTVNSAVNFVDNKAEKAINSVNYVATNLATPVAEVAVKTGLRAGKGIFKTGAKMLSCFLNDSIAIGKETAREISNDPEILKARQNVRTGMNTVKRGVNNKMGITSGSGVTIN